MIVKDSQSESEFILRKENEYLESGSWGGSYSVTAQIPITGRRGMTSVRNKRTSPRVNINISNLLRFVKV